MTLWKLLIKLTDLVLVTLTQFSRSQWNIIAKFEQKMACLLGYQYIWIECYQICLDIIGKGQRVHYVWCYAQHFQGHSKSWLKLPPIWAVFSEKKLLFYNDICCVLRDGLNSKAWMKRIPTPPNRKEILMHKKIMFDSYHEKTCLCHMRTTKAQISLCICAVQSVPLLFAT